MPRGGSTFRRVVATLTTVALTAGCATARREPPRAQEPTVSVEAPTPAVPPAPALPPASIGPRAQAQEPPPPVPAPAPPPAQPPRPALAPPIAPPASAAKVDNKFVVLNFDNADIETVVQAASEILGFNYVLAPDVRGKVTVQTSGRIAQDEVFGVLLAILEIHGFTAVRSGNLYKILRIEGARERAVPTIVGSSADPSRLTDEVITQIVPIRYSSVTELASLLRPLISARGTLLAHRETNVLIITDAASNIRRVLDIIAQVDVEVAREELRIIQIQFADAADLASILNQLFATGRVRSAAPGVVPTPVTPPPVPGAPSPPGAPPAPAVPGVPRAPEAASPVDRPPLIIAERRSNSLIVHAKRHELETITRLVAQLDVNIYGGRRVFIYYAENAKAKDLAATLNAIYGAREGATTPTPPPGTTPSPYTPPRPGTPTPPPAPAGPPGPAGPAALSGFAEVGYTEGQVRFIADEVTNAVIVTTYPRAWQEIEQTIKQLDKMPRQVLIEVLVAEITLTDDIRLGIDWAVRSGAFRVGQQTLNATVPGGVPVPPSVFQAATTLGGLASGLTAFAFQTNTFLMMLNALASRNLVNVVSNPHVLTSENKKAVINVSNSIPIVTSQQVPFGGATTTSTTTTTAVVGTQSVEYRDAGVILTVTPRIGERGTVALDVKQEVNDIGGPEPPTNSRRIIKREAETSVVLLNNQTLVLGGLIRDRRTTDDRGIPFLSRIPVLGYLFSAKVDTVEKTELLILITPRVIGTALDAARITEEMRRATPEIEEAIKRAPRQPTGPPPGGPGPSSAPTPRATEPPGGGPPTQNAP